MSQATIIDGKAFAADLRATVARQVATLQQNHGLSPGLSVILVGEDPAWSALSGAMAIAACSRWSRSAASPG